MDMYDANTSYIVFIFDNITPTSTKSNRYSYFYYFFVRIFFLILHLQCLAMMLKRNIFT